MKLIKISNERIYDTTTAILYYLDHENRTLYITAATGQTDLILEFPESFNLWAYLDEESNNQSWRNA